MNAHHPRACTALFILCATTALTGCEALARHHRAAQLQRVAADWNLALRASQVIPAYPPTEDLQPGDIFLVTTNIDRQHHAWTRGRYLPLDKHLARINPTGYPAFYNNSPARQLTTPASPTRPASQASPGNPSAASTPPALRWQNLPAAHFPAYSFRTRSHAAVNAVFPVSGIPISLGLLGSANTRITVQITDARTLGIDTLSLYNDLSRDWALHHTAFLKHFASPPHQPPARFLRVLSRIYLARRLQIHITSDRSTELNAETLAPAAPFPGGSIEVTARSANSISLQQTFESPVVFGYLGFDVAIRPDGRLGPPLPTLAVLEHRQTPAPLRTEPETLQAVLNQLLQDASLNQARNLLRTPYPDAPTPHRDAFGILIGTGPTDPADPNRDRAIYRALRQYLQLDNHPPD